MATRAPDLSKQRLRLWLQLLKATRHVENEIRERLRAEFSTTLPRFDVLATLEKNRHGLKMSEISSELMVSNGNVTGIIERLVGEGLVVRVPIQGDRRATLVQLTPKGCKEFSVMAATHEGWIDGLLGAIDEPEISETMAVLARVRELT